MTEETGATVSRMIFLSKSHPDAGAGSDYNEFFFCGILLTGGLFCPLTWF